MRPPVCYACGPEGRFGHSSDFRIIRFADYVPAEEVESPVLRGEDWFCPDHATAAEQLGRNGFTLAQAVEELRRRDDGPKS